MTNNVVIKYGDIAFGAGDDFSPASDDRSYFTNFSQLQKDLSFPNYANPCEYCSVPLDNSCLMIPENTQNLVFGWWSEQLTNEDGVFDSIVKMTATADYVYSSPGITFIFDEENNVYSNDINIEWYRGEEIIADEDFVPDSAVYFCKKRVEYYDKIVVTFRGLNAPKNRLKLHSVIYGYGAEFSSKELSGVKIMQKISPMSTELAINTCDFNLITNRSAELSFQDRQSIETYVGGVLRSKTFIKDFKRKSKTQWDIKTEDYVGIMTNVPFYGGIYENALALDLLEEIFTVAKIPYTVQDGKFDSVKLSGYIPFTNCREALMQVAFAIGGTVDTSNRQDVYIYSLSDELSQKIPLKRIMQGQNFQTETKMTAFELVAHQYRETEEVITLYDAKKSGAGENILVKFSEPARDLQITSGQIIDSGANYALINAEADSVLTGKKYEHNQLIKRKTNPLATFTDSENIISVKNATLVSANNIDNLLERCYNYFVNSQKINLKIAERRYTEYGDAIKYGDRKYGQFRYGQRKKSTIQDLPVNVGDFIEVATECSGNIQGRVIEQKFSLSGNIVVKDTVVR